MPQVEIRTTPTRGVQVFKADNDAELIAKLTKAQQHATEHISNLTKELRLLKAELFKTSVVISKVSVAIAAGDEPALIAALKGIQNLTSDWKYE
jgi:transposase